MKNFLGHFFNTLSYRVDKEIKESLYRNQAFLNSRWGFIEKSIVQWSTHYKKYILLSLVIAGLLTCNLILWQPWVKPFVMTYLPDWRELLKWQGAFLGGQLTIIGVVYPLVVGLISVLFQNKSAKKIIFPIYQKYSGFMFAGLSGLALSGFIVAGYFFRATFSDPIYVTLCLTTAMWISSNLLLTAWFFVKTFRMLDDNSREKIVFRFSINEACEIDVRRRIKQVLLDNAVHHKLIDNPDEKVIEVSTFKYSSNDYREITRKVKREESLKDVRLWLLNAAIWLQVRILKLRKKQGGKLVVQPLRSRKTSDVMIIARYDGFDINPIIQLLIKVAFSFEKETTQVDIGLTTVLNGFVGPANDALRNGDVKEFSDAIDNLALWHTEIAQALSFKNDEGNLDNWLLLPSSGIWGRNYLDELLREYYRLAREAVERIPDSSRFYTDMLYLHKRIYSNRDSLIKQEMRSLIQGSYYMWYLLVEWRSYNSESGDLRVANKYEDILYDFVGAWESWLMFIEPRSKRTRDIGKTYPAFTVHLELTASTAISALRFNNFEAAGWGVDMLINWLEKLSRDDHWNKEYSWRSVLINHYLLPLKPDNIAWQAILRGNDYDYSAAFDISFKNAHIDLRVITACYMLLKPGDDHPDFLAKYVNALLAGERIHPSGSMGRPRHNILNAGDLVGAYIRHRDYGHYRDGTYGSWLSSILESFGRIYEERRVSGRIYSGWGADEPRSMNRAYVEIAISMSSTKWRLSNDWEEALLSEFFRHMDRESIISDLRDWIKIAKEDHEYILVDQENLDAFKSNFIQSVEDVIQRIGDAQIQAVVDAEIDQAQLVKFGKASSAIFSDKTHSKFPLVLFKYLDHDAELDDNYSFRVNITNYAKERVALGVETNRAVNEDEWMADCISNDLKLNILRALLRYPQSESYEYTDVDSILSDIRNLSESMACPVLFIGSQKLRSKLRRSSYDQDIADKYDIRRQDGFDNEYICHIGGCEVYSLRFSNIDFCLLTTKEIFETVTFFKITEDQYVNVDFELNEDSDTIGKLILKYQMKVDLTENTRCIRLELSVANSEVTETSSNNEHPTDKP